MIKWIMAMSILFICGCGAEYAGGLATGVVIEEIARSAENNLLNAITDINETTARLNSESGSIIKSFKGKEKDPTTWIALASVLANAFWGGKSYGGKRK
jgi:hypothetical protein